MAAVPARTIEHTRAERQTRQRQRARNFSAASRGTVNRAVLEQVVVVEIRRPPVEGRAQKNTGSR
jgi:hypothetical protein